MATNIHVIEGDITLATVDAIVNAADPLLLGGGGVDGAIHQAAGPTLLEECLQIKAVRKIRCPVGQARLTGAGDLASKHVIHTVGPKYHREEHPQKLLAAAYRHSLELALANNCQSIAFPAISCGTYGYPVREAAEVAIAVCMESQFKGIEILFYLYGQKNYSIWQSVFDKKS